MATTKQIAANRRNAQKSTGPKTPAGKDAARFNALKHGLRAASILITGESVADFDALAAAYYAEHNPQTATQIHYLQSLILCDWLRRRFFRLQSESLGHLVATERRFNPSDFTPTNAFGRAYVKDTRNHDSVVKLLRHITTNDRTYDRALASLNSLNAPAAANEPKSSLSPQPVESESLPTPPRE